MKNQSIRFLPFLFVLISLINTAFNTPSNRNSMPKTLTTSTVGEVSNLADGSVGLIAPPQYQAPKMSFFERIIANKLAKKLKKLLNNPTDLDKTAKESKSFGTVSLILVLLAVPFVLLASFMGASPFPLIVLVILAALAVITGIVALSKSRLVKDHPQSTYQKLMLNL